jgi:fumarate reductase flavoprotein subunit
MADQGDAKIMTRRSFIKGAAIGAGAIGLAGLNAQGLEAAPPPKRWEKEADIVIIGAGGAGLMAAIQAHDAGARVMVLEKRTSVFESSTAISGGGYSAAGTEAQKKQGI